MTRPQLALLLLNTMLLAAGQFLWKLGLLRSGKPFGSVRAAAELLLSPYVAGGIAVYGAATVLWLYIVSKVDLSYAYPIQSLAYLLSIFGAYYLFGEPLSGFKIAGCLLILAGAACVGLSARL